VVLKIWASKPIVAFSSIPLLTIFVAFSGSYMLLVAKSQQETWRYFSRQSALIVIIFITCMVLFNFSSWSIET
jgi:predicted anti-sigma-YlaC factor YlaD